MAHDDRDLNLEKALARHFHAVAPHDSKPASTVPSLSSCPDAETLAAYHDASLHQDERNLWKPHVLSCDACQLVLAHLATPLEAPVASTETLQSVLASAPAIEPSVPPQPATSAAAPVATVSIARSSKVYLRWLVPAGAVAAGLLLWIASREPQPAAKLPSERVEVADNRPAASRIAPQTPSSVATRPPEQEQPQLKAASPNQKEKDLSSQPALTVPRRVDLDKESRPAPRAIQHASTQNETATQNARASAHGPSLSMQQQQRQQASAISAGAGSALLGKKSAEAQAGARLAQNARDAAPQPAKPVPPLPQEPSFLSADAIAPTPPPAQKTAPAAAATPNPPPSLAPSAASKAKSATGAPDVSGLSVSASTALVTESAVSSRLRSVAMQAPQTFSTPDGKIFWRVGLAGSVEYSSDKGATWASQNTGVSNDLLTGSAPASKVCWVVGRSGIILRTIDSGATWVKIGTPVSADFISVRASSAFRATIVFIDDPKTGATKAFQTSDGGVTWSSVPNE